MSRARIVALCGLSALAAVAHARPAQADNTLHVDLAKLDPPTVITLGVQLLVTGDDNFNATVMTRYRRTGTTTWRDALPLFRVHPANVAGYTVAAQFAGSIFDLLPDTPYDIELHAKDPDGNVDQVIMLPGRTRPVPLGDPLTPRAVSATNATSLRAALAAAQAGDVIILQVGTYAGTFSINASGTVDNPIVIRGSSMPGVVLDGQSCTGCNLFEVYGSNVHIEHLTMQNAERAVRWQGMATTGNVLRRVHIRDVTLGIGGKPDQSGFYVCDNVVEGRLSWPLTYGDDSAAHANDDGLVIVGSGHTVCHNTISGFADALQNSQDGARANDFYGNDILWTYDDGIELDGMEGNGRCFRNRFTNTYDTLSFQPIHGGPAYAIRNVVVNVVNEEMKLHALGGNPPQEPSGVLAYHNTFVRAYHAIQLSTPNVVRDYQVVNNLFVAPAMPTNGRVVHWDTPIDYVSGTIDYNGYFPDGEFEYGYGPTGALYASFAAVQAGGRYERHGVLLGASTFASGLMAPTDHHPKLAPPDAKLAAGAVAIDKGVVLANVDDDFKGTAPDLGAIELGCIAPTYGPRPDGVDETNELVGCASSAGPDGGVAGDGGGPSGGDGGGGPGGGDGGSPGNGANGDASSTSGCGCSTVPATTEMSAAYGLALAALFFARRRRGVQLTGSATHAAGSASPSTPARRHGRRSPCDRWECRSSRRRRATAR